MVRFLASGDTALVVEFGNVVDRAINARVLALAGAIDNGNLAGVIETVPTFRSLMVHYDPLATSHAALKEQITQLLEHPSAARAESRLWILPVCYDPVHGLDLAEVSQRLGLTPDKIIALHSGVTLRVYMLGFLPGSPYLGDTPRELALPRRDSPRVRVPQGSVAIALNQSVVYPFESPGGWHVLGRTPARLYDGRRDPTVFLRPDDEVRFRPVSLAEHDALELRAQAGEAIEVKAAA